jgi:hypothetical protein
VYNLYMLDCYIISCPSYLYTCLWPHTNKSNLQSWQKRNIATNSKQPSSMLLWPQISELCRENIVMYKCVQKWAYCMYIAVPVHWLDIFYTVWLEFSSGTVKYSIVLDFFQSVLFVSPRNKNILQRKLIFYSLTTVLQLICPLVGLIRKMRYKN